MAAFNFTAQLLGHGLLAIANTKHRYTGRKNGLWSRRGVVIKDGSGTARKDNRSRRELSKSLFSRLVRHDFAIYALLAHTTGNELRHLTAKIDDQNFFMRFRHLAHPASRYLCQNRNVKAVRSCALRCQLQTISHRRYETGQSLKTGMLGNTSGFDHFKPRLTV